MITEQDWLEAYKEICALLKHDPDTNPKGIEEVKHYDLWREQVDYMEEEYPWPPGSLFLEFNCVGIDTDGLGVQNMNFEVGVIFALDTLGDTYIESETMDVALAFGAVLKKIHNKLQGTAGESFSSMSRIGFRRVSAPQYLMVYKQTYSTIIRDMSGMKEKGTATVKKQTVKKRTSLPYDDGIKLYNIP
jgi:hypothetical protein